MGAPQRRSIGRSMDDSPLCVTREAAQVVTNEVASALARANLKKTTLHDLRAYPAPDGRLIVVATTRADLLCHIMLGWAHWGWRT